MVYAAFRICGHFWQLYSWCLLFTLYTVLVTDKIKDFNGDGKVGIADVGSYIHHSLDYDGDGDVDVSDFIKRVDRTGDGKLDMKDIIKVLDQDGDGKLDSAEFMKLLDADGDNDADAEDVKKHLLALKAKITDPDNVKLVDMNGDGKLDAKDVHHLRGNDDVATIVLKLMVFVPVFVECMYVNLFFFGYLFRIFCCCCRRRKAPAPTTSNSKKASNKAAAKTNAKASPKKGSK